MSLPPPPPPLTVRFACQGSRDGAVVKTHTSHQCGPGSNPGLGVICGLSLLLVLVFFPRVFSSGTPVFHFAQKPTFLNSNSIWITINHFIMSLWIGRLRKHSRVIDIKYITLNYSFADFFSPLSSVLIE